MTQHFFIKPPMGVMLNCFSIAIPHFNDLSRSSLWEYMDEISKDGRVAHETFYLFGAFDVLHLSFSRYKEKLIEMQEPGQYQNIKGVMDFFVRFGLLIDTYPRKIDLKDSIKHNPLIGVITVKIRSEVWDEVYKFTSNFEEIKQAMHDLFLSTLNRSLKEYKYPRDTKDTKALLLLSYDFEDLIIIVFAHSFQFIKFFSTKVRETELKDILDLPQKSKIKHIVVSTNTMLGIRMPNDSSCFSNQYYNKLREPNDHLRWFNFFQIHPGHLQNAINTIYGPQVDTIKDKVQVSPIAGRNDLIVYPNHAAYFTLKQFFDIHFEIRERVSLNSSFIASETSISFPDLDEVESDKAPGKMIPDELIISPDINRLVNAIDENTDNKLNSLEQESFKQMLRKLTYLLEDRYLQGSFISLTALVFRGITDYLKQKKSDRTANLDIWNGLTELCYAARYQGSPPVGETAVCPTLGSYSLGQKIQILLDYLGNWILKKFSEELGSDNFLQGYIATININCPDAAHIPIVPLPISFILVPPRPIFRTETVLVTFFHELGHCIFHYFLSSEIMSKKYHNHDIKKLVDLLDDAIAELFTIKILSDFDTNKYSRYMKECLSAFKIGDKKNIYMEDIKKKDKKVAMKLYELINSCGDDEAVSLLNSYLKEKGLEEFDSTELVHFLKFIIEWKECAVVQKVRQFMNSRKKLSEFWNLWMHVVALRGDAF